MDISNRALAMFLLAAIVVTLGGTIVSLNKLDSVSTTGLATTDTGTGNVSISVGETVSIILDDDTFDFGTCTPSNSVDLNVNTTSAGDATCDSDANDPFEIRNDGNVDVNVTVNASQVGDKSGGSLLADGGAGTSAIYYESASDGSRSAGAGTDGPGAGGCQSGAVGSWTEFTSTSTEYIVCSNLTSSGTPAGANTVLMDVRITIPAQAPTETDTVDFSFFAEKA